MTRTNDDRELEQLADAKGLKIWQDPYIGTWVVRLRDRPANDDTLNPYAVMVTPVRADVVRYVREHEGEHRIMSMPEALEAFGWMALQHDAYERKMDQWTIEAAEEMAAEVEGWFPDSTERLQ